MLDGFHNPGPSSTPPRQAAFEDRPELGWNVADVRPSLYREGAGGVQWWPIESQSGS